ncbi:hypothetical protein H8958_020961 [Nasalis larvatus]
MAAHGGPRFLLTFDFDETTVDKNSDDSIVRTVPGQQLQESLRATYRDELLQQVQAGRLPVPGQAGCAVAGPARHLRSHHFVARHGRPLQFVAKQGTCFEVILISDANTFGMESALRATGHHSLFRRILGN